MEILRSEILQPDVGFQVGIVRVPLNVPESRIRLYRLGVASRKVVSFFHFSRMFIDLLSTLDWQRMNIVGLANLVEQLVHDLGDPDSLARELSIALNHARQQLSDQQKIQSAVRMGFAPDSRSVSRTNENWLNEASKRALLVVLSAAMFHSRLDQDLQSIFPTGSRPKPLHDCLNAPNLIGELASSWKTILDVNYGPIFETALAVLTSTIQDNRLSKAIRTVVEAAQQISRDSAGLRHDLLGRIFHKTLAEPEFDGSFYTTKPAAVLLA